MNSSPIFKFRISAAFFPTTASKLFSQTLPFSNLQLYNSKKLFSVPTILNPLKLSPNESLVLFFTIRLFVIELASAKLILPVGESTWYTEDKINCRGLPLAPTTMSTPFRLLFIWFSIDELTWIKIEIIPTASVSKTIQRIVPTGLWIIFLKLSLKMFIRIKYF